MLGKELKMQMPEETSIEEILKSIRNILSEEPEASDIKKSVAKGVVAGLEEEEEEGVFVLTDNMRVNQNPLFSRDILKEKHPGISVDSFLATRTQQKVEQSLQKLKEVKKNVSVSEIENLNLQEQLQPLLKEWLDQNLPYIVEKIVEKEIKALLRSKE